MSGEKNESAQEHEDSPQGFPAESGDQESWLADLVDVRVVMFLLSVIVIAMTATVLIFSRDNLPNSNVDQLPDAAPVMTASQTGSPDTNEAIDTVAGSANQASQAVMKPPVQQADDGSFVLPISSAVLTGCETDSKTIENWQLDGSACWTLNIQDRQSGFFYCHVTYQAKFKSQFAVQLGDRSPLKFTVYPNESDFTEQMIVRLDTPEEPSFRLLAMQVEKVSGVKVKQVRLVPRK